MSDLIYPDIDLENVLGVMIDIDNTLYSYKVPHEAGLKKSYEYSINNKLINLSFDEFIAQYYLFREEMIINNPSKGVVRSRLIAFQNMFERYGVPMPYVHGYNIEKIYWNEFTCNMKADQSAISFLDECYSKAIKVCAVTNMQSSFQVEKIIHLGLSDRITYFVSSEEAGEEKPSMRIFDYALKKMNLSKSDVIMIGDDLFCDIQGATNYGLKSYLVKVLNKYN